MNNKLSEIVNISRQFQRSIKIDSDIENHSALEGYICQNTAVSVLENMAKHIDGSNQRAFTWTGPYGGGKSSLAIVLSSLVSSKARLRNKAKKILGLPNDHIINQTFHYKKKWVVIPIVGKRGSIVSSLAEHLSIQPQVNASKPASSSDVINRLIELTDKKNNGGVLLVIDELGKFLESASKTGEDIYFYQELAEVANRCSGSLVVVGVLHQAFEQYAVRLGREIRNEWAKVQGRYVDIPLISASDEVVELVSQAIEVTDDFDHKKTLSGAKIVVKTITKRRPGTPKSLVDSLYRCWPLQPITASLIGPISKRRFSQNERSIFGFLSSVEPMSFTEFLNGHKLSANSVYTPAMYWDYLRTNLDLAIMSSPDGHRWAIAVDAVERSLSKGTKLHIELAKTIALIDLFSNGSGLAAETGLLKTSVPSYKKVEIEKALKELSDWSIIVYRKHLNAWAIFAGSDLDLDSEISNAREEIREQDIDSLNQVTGLNPVVAKRHYQTTGAMRCFYRSVSSSQYIEKYINSIKMTQGSSGQFILMLPENGKVEKATITIAKRASLRTSACPALIIGVPSNAEKVGDLQLELSALDRIFKNSSLLEGDAVARREIDTRKTAITFELEEEMRSAFNGARWFIEGEEIKDKSSSGLSSLASDIADKVYNLSPYIHSELINRDVLSSNTAKARRMLMYRMWSHEDIENLGFSGYPVEAGLYYTALRSTGLHTKINGSWKFSSPSKSKNNINNNSSTLIPAWKAINKVIKSKKPRIVLSDIYKMLSFQPYGIKDGYLPILVFSYFLANRKNLGLYINNMFIPEVGEVHIDEWLQDSNRISLSYINIEKHKEALLEELSDALSSRLKRRITPDPLDSARALVALIYNLPNWTKKTRSLSSETIDIIQMLLKASDPHKVIFNDLPNIYNVKGKELAVRVAESINEIVVAYTAMLNNVASAMLKKLDHENGLEEIRSRAENISGRTGDSKLDAFATRLRTYNGSDEDIEGIISLSISKPPSEWVDRDIDAALINISDLSLNFRKVETLVSFGNTTESNSRRSMAVIFSSGGGYTVSEMVDVQDNDRRVNNLVNIFLKNHKKLGEDNHIFLAALAEAGARLLESNK